MYFAVDGEELAELLGNSGFSIVLTDPELPSGTDRIAAANREIQANLILNIQGDEPLVERSHILALASGLELDKASMSTVAVPFSSEKDFWIQIKLKFYVISWVMLYTSQDPPFRITETIPRSGRINRQIFPESIWVCTDTMQIFGAFFNFSRG